MQMKNCKTSASVLSLFLVLPFLFIISLTLNLNKESQSVEASVDVLNDFLQGTETPSRKIGQYYIPGQLDGTDSRFNGYGSPPSVSERVGPCKTTLECTFGETLKTEVALIEELDEALFYYAECKDIQLGGLTWERDDSASDAQNEVFTVNVTDVKASCKLNFRLQGIDIDGITGSWSINTAAIFVDDKNTPGATTSIEFRIELSNSDSDLVDALPNVITIPRDHCSFVFDMDIQVVEFNCGPSCESFGSTTLLDAVIEVFEPTFEFVICTFLETQGSATIDNGNEEDGIFADLLVDFRDEIQKYRDRDSPDWSDKDSNVGVEIDPDKVATALVFPDSVFVGAVSTALNDWLGASTQVSGLDIIFQEIVTLLSDPDGQFEFDDLSSLGASFSLETPLVTIDLTLEALRIVDLHEVTSLNLLQIPVLNDPQYTLRHLLSVDTIGLDLDLKFVLSEGTWSAPSNVPSSEFSFTYTLKLDDFDVDAYTLILVDPASLLERQVGQLLGDESEPIVDRVLQGIKCASPSIFAANLTYLEVNVSSALVPPEMSDLGDANFQQFVNDATSSLLDALRSVLQQDFTEIIQKGVRVRMNDEFAKILAKSDECITFEGPGPFDDPNFADLENSLIFHLIETFVMDVIGGETVRDSSASINTLVEILAEFLFTVLDAPFEFDENNDKWTFTPDVRISQGTNATVEANLQLEEFTIENLGTIYSLTLESTGPHSGDFHFAIGGNELMGGASLPKIFLGSTSRITLVPEDGGSEPKEIDEEFTLDVGLEGLQLDFGWSAEIDLDLLYPLPLHNLTRMACLFLPINRVNITTLTASTDDIEINFSRGTPVPDPTAPLAEALVQLEDDLNDNKGAILNVSNYILQSILNGIKTSVNEFDFNVVDTTVDECATAPAPIGGGVFTIIGSIFNANITDVFLRGTQEQPEVPPPSEQDENVQEKSPDKTNVLEWDDTFVGGLIYDLTSRIDDENAQETLRLFGNNTGDPLSDIFILEDDDSITLKIALDNIPFLSGLSIGSDLDGFIDGGKLLGGFFIIRNFDNVDFDALKVMQPLSKFVTETYISAPGSLKVEFNLTFEVPEAMFTGNENDPGSRVEELFFEIEISDLVIDIQALIALNWDAVGALSLGQFLDIDPETQSFSFRSGSSNCFFGSFLEDGLLLSKLEISVGSFGDPSFVSNLGNPVVSKGVTMLIDAILKVFAQLWMNDLVSVSQGLFRSALNDLFLLPRVREPGICRPSQELDLPEETKFLNYEVSNTADFVRRLTSEFLAGDDEQYTVFNALLSGLIGGTDFLSPPASVVDQAIQYRSIDLGEFSGSFGPLRIDGIDTVTNLNLLEPTGKHSFFTNASIAGPTKMTLLFDWEIEGLFASQKVVKDQLQLDVTFTGIDIGANILLKVDLPQLFALDAQSFANITQIACLFRAIEEAGVSDFQLDVVGLKVELSCTNICNSPILSSLQGGGVIGNEDEKQTAELITGVIKLVVNFVNSQSFQDTVDEELDAAEEGCATALDLSEAADILSPRKVERFRLSVVLALGFMGMFSGGLLALMLTIPRHMQKSKKHLRDALMHYQSIPGSTSESVAAAMAKEERNMMSIFSHPVVPKWQKYAIPGLIILTLIILFVAFTAVDAFRVDIRLEILGSTTQDVALVPFTIASTVDDLWNAEAYFVSLFVAVSSCAWPPTKNVLLFFLWFAPTTLVDKDVKTLALDIMDLLGKWSLATIYVVVLLIAGLTIYVSASFANILPSNFPEDFFAVDNTATPDVGILFLSVATVMSLGLNHLVVHWNERTAYADRRFYKQLDNEQDDMLTNKAKIKLKCSNYVFSTTDEFGRRDRYGIKAKNLVLMFLGSTAVLTICAISVPLFTFDYNGVIGLALGVIGRDNSGNRLDSRTFSLMSLGTFLPDAARETAGSRTIIVFFQLLYFVTILVAPLLQVFLLGLLWLRPLNHNEARIAFQLANIAFYWSAFEVFLLTIIATGLQVEQIALFIVDFVTGGVCGNIQPTLADVLGTSDGYCVNVVSHLEWGFYVAVVAVLVMYTGTAIAIRGIRICLRDREYILEGTAFEDRQMMTWAEAKVANLLFPNGAKHHMPVKQKKVRREKPKKETNKWNTVTPAQQQFQPQPQPQPHQQYQQQQQQYQQRPPSLLTGGADAQATPGGGVAMYSPTSTGYGNGAGLTPYQQQYQQQQQQQQQQQSGQYEVDV